MSKKEKVPVSERALVQRINRKLKASGQQLKAARGERAEAEVGEYYVIDTHRNILILKHVNLAALGVELGALADWERLEGARA